MGNTDKFEMIANTYDTSERVQIAEVSAKAIGEYLVDTTSKTAMDFGCGTGLVGMSLLKNFNSILFVDASQSMVNQLRKKIADSDVAGASALCFDLEKGDLPDLHVDYIFMSQVLLHINDIELILSRLYEALNEKGHLLIVDFDKNEKITSGIVHHGFDQKELADIMAKIGYTRIQSKTFYTGSKIFMGQDASMFILDCQRRHCF